MSTHGKVHLCVNYMCTHVLVSLDCCNKVISKESGLNKQHLSLTVLDVDKSKVSIERFPSHDCPLLCLWTPLSVCVSSDSGWGENHPPPLSPNHPTRTPSPQTYMHTRISAFSFRESKAFSLLSLGLNKGHWLCVLQMRIFQTETWETFMFCDLAYLNRWRHMIQSQSKHFR